MFKACDEVFGEIPGIPREVAPDKFQKSFLRNIRSSIFPLIWIFLRTYALMGLSVPSMSPWRFSGVVVTVTSASGTSSGSKW